jgi:4-amino-4-deoxy-L-arabinose transferase-like glycosyltransferase
VSWLCSPWTLLLAVAVLRLPGLFYGVLDIDESDFALIARRIAQGAMPYVDIADIKPPLAFLAYLPSGIFDGAPLWPTQAAAVLWVGATSLVLRAAARRMTGSEEAGWAAAWLALIAGLCELPKVSTEMLMNLPSAAALFFWVRAEEEDGKRFDLAAGACIAMASLFRQQGAVLLLSLGAVMLFRGRVGRLFSMAAGFAIPWGLTVGFFAGAGHFAEFWDWVVRRNLGYTSLHEGWLGRFAEGALPSVAATLASWIVAVRASTAAIRRGPSGVEAGLIASLVATCAAVSVGGRFYNHYFLQFVPVLALLGAGEAARLVRKWPRMATALCLLPALGLGGFAIGRGMANSYPSQEPRAREVAAWLKQNTQSDERLFIWGHYSPIYLMAHRLPGTRYLTTSVHVGNFDPAHVPPGFDFSPYRSDADVALTLHDLEQNRVPIFVDTAGSGIHSWDRVPLTTVPALASYLAAHYRAVAEVAGARIYRRSD